MESEPDAAVRVLERALLERLDARRGGALPSGLVGRAVQALEVGDAEPVHIHALARSLRVSERKLRIALLATMSAPDSFETSCTRSLCTPFMTSYRPDPAPTLEYVTRQRPGPPGAEGW